MMLTCERFSLVATDPTAEIASGKYILLRNGTFVGTCVGKQKVFLCARESTCVDKVAFVESI